MFTPTDLLVGVDVHRCTNVVQVMNGAVQVLLPRLRVANNRPGTAQLVRQLQHLAVACNFARTHIAVEAAANYWLLFFSEATQLVRMHDAEYAAFYQKKYVTKLVTINTRVPNRDGSRRP